jgi:hypothetical protein
MHSWKWGSPGFRKKTYILLDQIRKLKYKENIIALMIFILEMVYTKPRFF